MAYWFGRFSLVGFCFITLLCWNVCWLAGSWMLDFWQFCNQFLGLWCPWVSFGMLGASTLASWRSLGRSWDDPGTLEGTRKGPVRSRLGFYRFFGDFGDPFWELFWYFWTKETVFFISISRLLFLLVFGSKFGCLGLEKQAFGMEGIAKINFCRNWISYDSRVDFSWFWVALGPIFMAFVALETGSKIDEFSWWFWGHPRSWAPCGWKAMRLFLGNSKQSISTWDMRHEKWETDPSEDPKYENTEKSRL